MNKKITLRPFAPKGILTETQTKQLMAWYNGEKRNISHTEIGQKASVSRQKLYISFKRNPERPFDELKLSIVNKIIQLYNHDIENPKKDDSKEIEKELKTGLKKAKSLIKKVEE